MTERSDETDDLVSIALFLQITSKTLPSCGFYHALSPAGGYMPLGPAGDNKRLRDYLWSHHPLLNPTLLLSCLPRRRPLHQNLEGRRNKRAVPGRRVHMFLLFLSSVSRKLTATQASYKPPPSSNPIYPSLSLSEARGITSDDRPRSSRQRVFLTKSRLEVPASDREKILFDVPVPQVGLPEMQPETEHTVLFATTVTTIPRHEMLLRGDASEPSAPAFGNLKIDGKFHFVWHLSWPGYNMRRTITFSPEDVGSTRQDLAYFVACHVKDFIVECATGALKGACADPNWAITEDKTLDDFGISSFWTPDNATWRVTVTMKRDIADELLFCVDKAIEAVAKGPQKTKRKKRARKAQPADGYLEECYYYGRT